jgi:hypothetical protein
MDYQTEAPVMPGRNTNRRSTCLWQNAAAVSLNSTNAVAIAKGRMPATVWIYRVDVIRPK